MAGYAACLCLCFPLVCHSHISECGRSQNLPAESMPLNQYDNERPGPYISIITRIIFSLLVGAAFIFIDISVSYFSSFGSYLFWVAFRNIVWPAIFIYICMKYKAKFNALVSLIGLMIGVFFASIISAKQIKWPDILWEVLGYVVYSASLLPILILTIFFAGLGVKQIYDQRS